MTRRASNLIKKQPPQSQYLSPYHQFNEYDSYCNPRDYSRELGSERRQL